MQVKKRALLNQTNKKPRPKLLTGLCIVSAVSGALWIIMLVALIFYSLKGSIPSGLFPGLAAGYPEAGMLFMAALILLALLGLIGIFMMWQINKTGFYLYSIVKTLIYFLPVVFIGSTHLTYMGLFLTSISIILYGIIFTSLIEK